MDVTPFTDLRLFEKLPQRALNALAGIMTERNWKANETVITQGTHSDGVYILLDGQIKVTRITNSGASVILNTFQPGAVFGTLSSMDGGLRGANCVSQTDVKIAFLARADFLELMSGSSPLSLGFQVVVVRSIFADIRRTNDELAELSSLLPINAEMMED
jgi:CRP/FNR family transcriptional regulator